MNFRFPLAVLAALLPARAAAAAPSQVAYGVVRIATDPGGITVFADVSAVGGRSVPGLIFKAKISVADQAQPGGAAELAVAQLPGGIDLEPGSTRHLSIRIPLPPAVPSGAGFAELRAYTAAGMPLERSVTGVTLKGAGSFAELLIGSTVLVEPDGTRRAPLAGTPLDPGSEGAVLVRVRGGATARLLSAGLAGGRYGAAGAGAAGVETLVPAGSDTELRVPLPAGREPGPYAAVVRLYEGGRQVSAASEVRWAVRGRSASVASERPASSSTGLRKRLNDSIRVAGPADGSRVLAATVRLTTYADASRAEVSGSAERTVDLGPSSIELELEAPAGYGSSTYRVLQVVAPDGTVLSSREGPVPLGTSAPVRIGLAAAALLFVGAAAATALRLRRFCPRYAAACLLLAAPFIMPPRAAAACARSGSIAPECRDEPQPASTQSLSVQAGFSSMRAGEVGTAYGSAEITEYCNCMRSSLQYSVTSDGSVLGGGGAYGEGAIPPRAGGIQTTYTYSDWQLQVSALRPGSGYADATSTVRSETGCWSCGDTTSVRFTAAVQGAAPSPSPVPCGSASPSATASTVYPSATASTVEVFAIPNSAAPVDAGGTPGATPCASPTPFPTSTPVPSPSAPPSPSSTPSPSVSATPPVGPKASGWNYASGSRRF